jgi:hypothetical protein
MTDLPSAIRLPNGKILTRRSNREEIWAVRRDAVMGKIDPGEEINLVTYSWLNDAEEAGPGNGVMLTAHTSRYGIYNLKDDYPLFAIYDPACYHSFVSNFWEWDTLVLHFARQMRLYCLLVASAGVKGDWQINIQHEPVTKSGVREISGSIMAAGSRLILCDYGHLTMGAQFPDIKLPDDEPFGAYEIKVRPGTYNVRVIQFNLEPGESGDSNKPDIILEIVRAHHPLPPWEGIVWNELGRMGI